MAFHRKQEALLFKLLRMSTVVADYLQALSKDSSDLHRLRRLALNHSELALNHIH